VKSSIKRLLHWPVGGGALLVTVDREPSREVTLLLVTRDVEPEPDPETVLHANCTLLNSQVVDREEKPLQTRLVTAFALAPANEDRGTMMV